MQDHRLDTNWNKMLYKTRVFGFWIYRPLTAYRFVRTQGQPGSYEGVETGDQPSCPVSSLTKGVGVGVGVDDMILSGRVIRLNQSIIYRAFIKWLFNFLNREKSQKKKKRVRCILSWFVVYALHFIEIYIKYNIQQYYLSIMGIRSKR